MPPRTHGLLPRVLQVFAIALLALICGIVLHKGFADVSALAEQHRGGDFWPALLRYVFRNLAG
ncbi:hypothetical protein [Ramlibacter tataouinensis]|uniref:Candidate membrane protein n=1 Tax=Ramlibacter tataouinensis (strain ATCC BAA-407 / DSM 14655 / LMG 21543 / TTB310) TaxID=365046 RepID=F5Y665_RAMTT|nr:hypothetical protein [Ramlibacter tataouinensis]AEG92751.1 hypothetical protein Rta_16590 [Ramlibacter tataouinensis TTB310]